MLLGTVLLSEACGPYNPIIPTPDYFATTGMAKTLSDYDREENLMLWRDLTDPDIPLADIEQAVYRDAPEVFGNYTYYGREQTDNSFYNYLFNTGDYEIIGFLEDAKNLEKQRSEISSPWYYPRKRDGDGDPDNFDYIIDAARRYKGSRLRDRYALQATRALFASRRYAECVTYVDSAFSAFPDSNLMKRMARRYAAGSLRRLGDTARADTIFALAGDIMSLSCVDPVRFMCALNPDAPQIIDYIRANVRDTVFMLEMKPTALRMLADRRVRCKGDWNFLLAVIENEYLGSPGDARRHIHRSLRQRFSSENLQDLARAYKMKTDARAGARESLLADLRWIESKTDLLGADRDQWIRRIRNIVYEDAIPQLWKSKDYTTAILLCAYADNLDAPWYDYDTFDRRHTPENLISDMRLSETATNTLDYSSLSFQLMESLTSAQLSRVCTDMKADTPLYRFLRRNIRTDSDYYNELIGTLALREENYGRAADYLSRVSHAYQRRMNIYKQKYLARDPFAVYPSRWVTHVSSYDGSEWEYEHSAGVHDPGRPQIDAKLSFAREMLKYRAAMKSAPTPDRRGLARLMYAIGRRNSLEECWALTQYGRGFTMRFSPDLQYWEDDFAERNYDFLFDYHTGVGHKKTDEIYDREVRESLAMLTTDEARARAQYILGNLVTVARRYPDTSVGRFVRTSCDNWNNWL